MERLKTAPLWVWEELLQRYKRLARTEAISGGYPLSPERRADAEYVYALARDVVGGGARPSEDAWDPLRQRLRRLYRALEPAPRGP